MYVIVTQAPWSGKSDTCKEFVTRPTARADWWDEPNKHVLGGRDLQRDVRGTWLGLTKQGRIAVLTNFREEGQDPVGLKSRGGIVNSFLTTPPESKETTESFAKRLIEDVGAGDVGGFSLAFGQLRNPSAAGFDGLAIVSNRTPDAAGVVWIAAKAGETHGLSNSHFGDFSWPKVVHGQMQLSQLIHSHVSRGGSKDALIERLFWLLSIDTLPKQKQGEDWETFVRQLRNSIFIPPVGGNAVHGHHADEIAAAKSQDTSTADHGLYATQKQTVIIVDKQGHATFVERTLYDEDGRKLSAEKDTRTVEFDIEGWSN